MKHLAKFFLPVTAGLILSLTIHSTVVAQDSGGEGEITGFPPKMGKVLKKTKANSPGASECGRYVRKKGWTIGFNKTNTRKEFAVAVGMSTTTFKKGVPGFIDDRYVTFREALIEAKKAMAKMLEARISSSTMSRLSPKKNQVSIDDNRSQRAKALRKQAAGIKTTQSTNVAVKDTYKKGLRWVNEYLDNALKDQGYDAKAAEKARLEGNKAKRDQLLAEARKVEAAAKKVLKSKGFSEVIQAAAKQNLKGIYTAFAAENLPSDSDYGTICVVARYSKPSVRLADAMAARDFRNVPMFPRHNKTILQQLPDPSTNAGLFKLVTSWGLEIQVDENGDVNLIAHGQAEEDKQLGMMARDSAIGSAKLAAENLIRMFINSTVKLQEKATTARTVKAFVNGTNEVKISRDYEKSYEQTAGWRAINGITPLFDWGAPHPVTGQVIWGAVARWNASQAVAGIKSKVHHDRKVRDTGGQRYKDEVNKPKQRAGPNSSGTQQRSRNTGGTLRGSTKSRDF